VRLVSGLFITIYLLLWGMVVFSADNEERFFKGAPIDTVYADYPYLTRVYNWRASEARGPSVPFVELDTNTYEKKLWICEKKLLSSPIKSRFGRVVAHDSAVYVAYTVQAGYPYLYSTYSYDHGRTWPSPNLIQGQGYYSGHRLLIDEQRLYISYPSEFSSGEDLFGELLFRKSEGDLSVLSDSIIVDTNSSWSEGLYGPDLLSWGDSLFLSYIHYNEGVNYFRFCKSGDEGDTWIPISGDVVTLAGKPHFLLLTDTVLSEVCRSGSIEVRMHRSLDKGLTWPVETYLSNVDEYASQLPAACTDGMSDIHVVWYDFDGAPAGWGGYVFYRRTLNNGQSWEDIRSLSTEGYAEGEDIWSDTNRVYAVWNDSRFGSPNYGIFLRYSHDRGQSWSPEILVVDSLDPAWDPDVYGWNDYFYLVWEEQHPPENIWGIYYRFGVWYLPGDVDYSGAVNVADITYLVDYLFKGGNEPFVPDAAQMNGQGGVNVADVTYIVDYLFRNGPPPVGGEPGL
jgi:hypothetical protein